jgi:hypothetical protein
VLKLFLAPKSSLCCLSRSANFSIALHILHMQESKEEHKTEAGSKKRKAAPKVRSRS